MPACMARIAIQPRACVVVSTMTASSFSLSIIWRKSSYTPHCSPPDSSWTYRSARLISQSQAATTWKPFTSLPSRISRDRPPHPMTPTRTVSLADAVPFRPKTRPGTNTGSANAAAPACNSSRRVHWFRDIGHSSRM